MVFKLPKTKYEKYESVLMLFIVLGACILSIGIGLSMISPKGLSAILAMLGAFTTFVSTVALILLWTVKEMFS